MKQKGDVHVVYIITKLELGGAQKVCLSLFDGVQKKGIYTYLVSGTHGKLTSEVQHAKNTFFVGTLEREMSLWSMGKEIRCFLQLVTYLRKLKKKYPYLIVHTHSTKAGILGRWAAFFAGIKKRIHTVHGYAFHQNQRLFIWFTIYSAELITSFITTHFVCVSSQDVKIGTKLFPYFAQKHSIIRAAVDVDQFYIPARKALSYPKLNKHFVFGSISCFKPQKNIFDMLNAFAHVYSNYPHVRLELIGDGTLRMQIESWINTHKLTNVITLHGWQNQVAPIMINWHAFLLTSLWEGLPRSIVEARMLQLPVISYNTGGIQDIIIEHENGLLFKQGNWQDLAHGMIKLIKNPQLFDKMQNYKDDLRDFDNKQMIDLHSKLYYRLLHLS